MAFIEGTHLNVQFDRVVDGDTIKAFLPGQDVSQSLRILALDTEESFAGSSKPVTPWGKAAKEYAIQFFANATHVTIEFPGNEPSDICLTKYRGNYGRPLVYVYLNGIDFQELMIREGYSPYFMKYGNATYSSHHMRYSQAEADAQRRNIGLWDQVSVNGSERRNYALLGTWWRLRAQVIEEFRALRDLYPSLLNTRLDYDTILEKAKNHERATIFTELHSLRRVGGDSGLINYGSDDRPFNLYIPDLEGDSGKQILQLLQNRYISSDEQHPRRNYAYISGELSLYGTTPQMVVKTIEQITDSLPGKEVSGPSKVVIRSLLADPEHKDAGKETITLENLSTRDVNLSGWILQDRSGNRIPLSGKIEARKRRTISIPPYTLTLNNTGDDIYLFNSTGILMSHVSYTHKDIATGEETVF